MKQILYIKSYLFLCIKNLYNIFCQIFKKVSKLRTLWFLILILKSPDVFATSPLLPKDIKTINYGVLADFLLNMDWYCFVEKFEVCSAKNKALNKEYLFTLKSESLDVLKTNRQAFILKLFQKRQDISQEYQFYILNNLIMPVTIHLFPDKTYEETIGEIKSLAIKSNFTDLLTNLERLNSITKPDDCPNVSLLHERSLLSTYEVGNQGHFGTCYAEAGVRALDFFNFTYANNPQRTSVFLSAVSKNVGRQRMFNIDGGFSEDIVTYLFNNGGCQLSELDQLLPQQRAEFIREVELAYHEILNGLKDVQLIQISLSGHQDIKNLNKLFDIFLDIAKRTSHFSSSTNDIFLKAIGISIDELKGMNPRAPDFNLIFKYIENISNLTNEFIHLSRNGDTMNFADFVLRKVYCKKSPITYPKVKYQYLQRVSDGERQSPNHWVQHISPQITSALNQSMAQPLIVYLCSKVFLNPLMTNNKTLCEGHHAVLLVGQKYNQELKQCQYQILNSWGSSTSNSHDYHSAFNQEPEKGVVWMPLYQLAPNSYRIFYLKP